MSVRKGERTEGRLKVLGEARNMCAYTLQICKNEKVIPKSHRWLMTQRIVGESLDAMVCISRANSYPLDDIVGSFLRHIKQIEARSHIKALLTLIQLAYDTFGIEGRRIEHWTELATNTDKALRAWMWSDKERSAFFQLDMISAASQILARFTGSALTA